jgi:hypothetical protein
MPPQPTHPEPSAVAMTKDRTTMLTILSGELAERLSKHPMPPRVILPLDPVRSRWRWVAWLGVPAIGGLAAATMMMLPLPDLQWTQPAEKQTASTGWTPGHVTVSSVPAGPIAAKAAASASEPAVSIVTTPPLASTETPVRVTPATPPPPVLSQARELSWTEVHELQARLRALKLDPGPLDGIGGPRTSAAVRRFQEARGAPVTGAIDLAVLDEVRKASGAGD